MFDAGRTIVQFENVLAQKHHKIDEEITEVTSDQLFEIQLTWVPILGHVQEQAIVRPGCTSHPKLIHESEWYLGILVLA